MSASTEFSTKTRGHWYTYVMGVCAENSRRCKRTTPSYKPLTVLPGVSKRIKLRLRQRRLVPFCFSLYRVQCSSALLLLPLMSCSYSFGAFRFGAVHSVLSGAVLFIRCFQVRCCSFGAFRCGAFMMTGANLNTMGEQQRSAVVFERCVFQIPTG
jgi:hypothetical protein